MTKLFTSHISDRKSISMLEGILGVVPVGLVVLLPFIFLPFTGDYFDLTKRLLFVMVSVVFVAVWGLRTLAIGQFTYTKSPFTLPFVLFAMSSLLTIAVMGPNRPVALLGTGGLYLALGLFFVTATSLLQKSFSKLLIIVMRIVGILLAVLTGAEVVGLNIGSMVNTFGFSIPEGAFFTPTGAPLFTFFVLVLCAVMSGVYAYEHRKGSGLVVNAVITGIIAVGVILTGTLFLPGKPTQPQFLSTLHSWSVATDVLKSPLTAVFGVGTDAYADAFSILRPRSLNQTGMWQVRFNNARNMPLELIVTQGLIGVAAFILLVGMVITRSQSAKGDQLPIYAGILLSLGYLLFFPANTLVLCFLVILMVSWTLSLKERGIGTHEVELTIMTPILHTAGVPTMGRRSFPGIATRIVGILIIATAGFLLLSLGRAYVADVSFANGVKAFNNGQGKESYESMLRAIQLNPYMENYRRAFALANLSLAQAIASAENPTDQTKQTALTLVQQSIGHAKSATVLNRNNTANWATLTSIYAALIGSAEEAEQWTVAALIQQIQTDPTNPTLRVQLGQVFRQAGNADQALRLYEQAAELKPDYAIAYYQMASIYKERGDKQNQLVMLVQTLNVLPQTSNEYAQIKAEAESLQKEVEAGTKAPATDKKPATSPTPAATPEAQTRLPVPSDAGLASPSAIPEVPAE